MGDLFRSEIQLLTFRRFFPSENPAAKDEITIWFNGGPGCSSLSGLLTENGPFLWQAGTLGTTANSYSWTNLTNMIWVEQPVGVGYSQGTPDIYNEVELAEQFAGFWKNFIKTFGMEGFKTYITGESYGGYYVPYVADEFIKQDDCEYFNLKGVAINDPIIGDDTIQEQGEFPMSDVDDVLTARQLLSFPTSTTGPTCSSSTRASPKPSTRSTNHAAMQLTSRSTSLSHRPKALSRCFQTRITHRTIPAIFSTMSTSRLLRSIRALTFTILRTHARILRASLALSTLVTTALLVWKSISIVQTCKRPSTHQLARIGCSVPTSTSLVDPRTINRSATPVWLLLRMGC